MVEERAWAWSNIVGPSCEIEEAHSIEDKKRETLSGIIIQI